MQRQGEMGRPEIRAARRKAWSGRAVAVTAAITRLAAASDRRMCGQAQPRRTMRGLLFTPWFVVSLGLVLAASLTIMTPRAVLVFSPGVSSRCADVGCPRARQAVRIGPGHPWRLPTATRRRSSLAPQCGRGVIPGG